ncbi:hypothetical protein HDU91_004212, partial [Kappamyces sp. JEL0680]
PPKVSVAFNTFSVAAKLGAVASAIHVVLFWDFGDKPHIFTPVRSQFARLANWYFTLTPLEMMEYEQAKRGKRQKMI